jgi:hypothetical protein
MEHGGWWLRMWTAIFQIRPSVNRVTVLVHLTPMIVRVAQPSYHNFAFILPMTVADQYEKTQWIVSYFHPCTPPLITQAFMVNVHSDYVPAFQTIALHFQRCHLAKLLSKSCTLYGITNKRIKG